MPKSVAAVLDEHVELLERALVHQELDALARGELAALVLRLDARLAAAEPRAGAPGFELVEDVLHARRSAQIRPGAVGPTCLKHFPQEGEFRDARGLAEPQARSEMRAADSGAALHPGYTPTAAA